MRKIVFFIFALFAMFGMAQGQWNWLTVEDLEAMSINSDTLQISPRIYCYNWPDTSKYHDSMECNFVETTNLAETMSINYITDAKEFALYQHTDVPLDVVGIAFRALEGGAELLLYDSAMNMLASDTMTLNDWYYMDSSKFEVFFLPGKSNVTDRSPLSERILLYKIIFDENNPIQVNGDFWIGLKNLPRLGRQIPLYIHENHEPPYRINNVRYRKLMDDGWTDSSTLGMGRSLPELFVIVKPQCHDVEGLTAVMDSLGNVDVTWDSAYNQTQYVVEMHGPGVAVMDTVSECHWHYPLLYPSMAYAVKVKARCFREKDNVWSNWTGTVQFGNTAIDAVEYEPLTVTLTPNPTKDNVTVAAEGYDEAVTVSVTSISGVELIRCEKVTLPLTLDTKGLAAGVYMVRVLTAKGTATRRLMVQ